MTNMLKKWLLACAACLLFFSCEKTADYVEKNPLEDVSSQVRSDFLSRASPVSISGMRVLSRGSISITIPREANSKASLSGRKRYFLCRMIGMCPRMWMNVPGTLIIRPFFTGKLRRVCLTDFR